VAVYDENNKERGTKVCHFTEQEFLIGMGIMIAAAGFNFRGSELWKTTSLDNETLQDPKTWVTINESPNFGKFTGEISFKEYRKLVPKFGKQKTTMILMYVGVFFGC
jgi:hypothetical protein